jgi:hypothetical protein
LKIVGVVNGYNEAKDIEEIVKVFVVKKRISNLLSDKIIKNAYLKDIILPIDEIKDFEKCEIKSISEKNNKVIKPLFNVRGIN